MEVHNYLGKGFSEIVYKDALEYELKQHGIPYQREREFTVQYKDILLPHKFYLDFFVWEKLVLELKAVSQLNEDHLGQTMNYLAVTKARLGILANFRANQLEYRRVVR